MGGCCDLEIRRCDYDTDFAPSVVSLRNIGRPGASGRLALSELAQDPLGRYRYLRFKCSNIGYECKIGCSGRNE